ncbi:MAG: (Fe-S)-binding protein [Vampirovibrionales bacterium]|nr:(Fe-S)-binding protein [Vampirovibrionales bacterium]
MSCPSTFNKTSSELSFLSDAQLQACIHCGLCLPVCPTYEATGSEAESPRGRLHLMKAWQDGSLDARAIEPHIDQCLGCMACQTSCPSGIDYNALLHQTRVVLADQPPSWRYHFKQWIKSFGVAEMLAKHKRLAMITHVLRFYQRLGIPQWVNQTGLLAFLSKTLQQQHALMPNLLTDTAPPLVGHEIFEPTTITPHTPSVLLWTGCLMNAWFSHIHWATLRVLVAQGYRVITVPSGCCGALVHHSGDTRTSQTLGHQSLQSIESTLTQAGLTLNDITAIVVNAAGCGSTLQEYNAFVEATPEGFSAKVLDPLALLAQQPLDLSTWQPPSQSLRVTYHAACHLHHAQGVKTAHEIVMGHLPNVTWVLLAGYDQCCGSAGVFNVEYPQLAHDILSPKIEALKATGASVLLNSNPGCLMQWQSGCNDAHLDLEILHPMEFLAKGYLPLPNEPHETQRSICWTSSLH